MVFVCLVVVVFLKPDNTNKHNGLFPSSHTCKNTRKVHAGGGEIQSVQTIMVYSSS